MMIQSTKSQSQWNTSYSIKLTLLFSHFNKCRSVINPNITVAAASIGSALSISKILKSLNAPVLCFIGGLGDDDDGTYVTSSHRKFCCQPDYSTFQPPPLCVHEKFEIHNCMPLNLFLQNFLTCS